MSLEMKYFVLKPRGISEYARASREAMSRYANVIAKTNPSLSSSLYDWVDYERKKAVANKLAKSARYHKGK